MSAFAMIGHDGPGGAALRKQHRQGHIDHVTRLHDDGRVVLAGPIKSEDGSKSVGAIIILTASDLAEAEAIVRSDPYVSSGVFETLTVEPFLQVFPEPQ